MVARRKKGHLPVPTIPKWLELLTLAQGEFLKTKDDRVVFERAVKHLLETEDDGAACVFLTNAKRYRAEGVIKDLWCQVSPFSAKLLTGPQNQSFLRQGHQTQCAVEYFG